ncbi:MAG: molybdate ABC transporter substrate-binding protein [Pseudomonadota bacterium]
MLVPASMEDAVRDVATAWEAQDHATVRLSAAGTSSLARQVLSGAEADIFISADVDWMVAAMAEGRVGASHIIATNRLVLIAGVDTAKTSLLQLPSTLGGRRLAIADPDAVPAGRYAKAALQRLDLWDGLKSRIAPTENVRAALALVERGAAPYGIVYRTDAQASANVRIVEYVPASAHPPIVYPAARLTSSDHGEAAALLAFLQGETARAILSRHGFGLPAAGPSRGDDAR